MEMTKERIIILAAALLALGVAVAAIWWSVTRDAGEERIAGPATLYAACEELSSQEFFDFSSELRGPWPFHTEDLAYSTFRVEGRVAGNDYHLDATHDNPKHSAEVISVGGVTHIRGAEGREEWRLDFERSPFINRLGRLLYAIQDEGPDSPYCPEGEIQNLGPERHEGLDVQRLRLEGKDLSEIHRSYTVDYWLGPSEQLVKVRELIILDLADELASFNEFELSTTFSGVGETNRIVAPEY